EMPCGRAARTESSSRRARRDADDSRGRPLSDAGNMAFSPSDQLAEHGPQIVPARGEGVLVARRVPLVPAPLEEAAPFEPTEPLGENVRRDAFGGLQELREAMLVVEEEVAQHEQRPRVAENIESAGDGAAGPKARGHGRSLPCRLQCASDR